MPLEIYTKAFEYAKAFITRSFFEVLSLKNWKKSGQTRILVLFCYYFMLFNQSETATTLCTQSYIHDSTSYLIKNAKWSIFIG